MCHTHRRDARTSSTALSVGTFCLTRSEGRATFEGMAACNILAVQHVAPCGGMAACCNTLVAENCCAPSSPSSSHAIVRWQRTRLGADNLHTENSQKSLLGLRCECSAALPSVLTDNAEPCVVIIRLLAICHRQSLIFSTLCLAWDATLVLVPARTSASICPPLPFVAALHLLESCWPIRGRSKSRCGCDAFYILHSAHRL